jgi:hypothetical protein
MSDVSPPTPDQRWHRCKNVDSVALDGHGLAKITSMNTVRSRSVLNVRRPVKADGFANTLAALGPTRIAPGGFGWCTLDWPAWVLYDTDTSPAAGQIWGPQDNSVLIKKGHTGFMTMGGGFGSPERVLVDHQSHYRKANWIRFALSANGLTTDDASVSGCEVLDWWDGFDPGSTVTVHNLQLETALLFEGAAGAVGLAFYDPLTDTYHIAQLECPD